MSAPVVKRSIGIVYAKDGWPKISPDWVKHLTGSERVWVDDELAKRGFRLNESLEVIEVN